jgi:uncharacterized membrane protein YuzA (DUF378 family)
MSSMTMILIGIAAVFGVLYMLRRKSRLNKED